MMPPDDAGFGFTREGVLGGMPARRASTLLFAIENRSALMAARARRAMARFETERTTAEREQLFLGALAEGRTPPAKATIQDIDRHAREWRDLVPVDPALRAALLGRIGAKYGLPAQAQGIRAALGADDPVVVAEYERQTGATLDALGTAPLSRRERFRWLRDRISRRIESLPPFWLAYALTLTETVGVGVLALPIAFSGFGPAGATLLLVVFGVLNMLTVAALVEAITRNGNMRYGVAFFGRLIGDYLGRPGNLVAMPVLFILEAVAFCVCLVGFGTTIAGVTGLPVVACAAGLFVVNAVIMWRDSLNVTVALAVALGLVNLTLIVGMSIIALASVGAGFAGSGAQLVLDASVLELIFGVGLGAYFGHTSAGHSARVVLARDPSGRHLLAGNVAAMFTAMVIYILFVLAVMATVGAGVLKGYEGTALTLLAERLGPVIDVMGTIYVLLTLGLGSMFVALGLFNQMGELIHGVDSIERRIKAAGHGAEFLVRAAPTAVLFGIVVILLNTGGISFSGVLGLVGTLTVPLLGGVFPMLLLVAARRRGERIPGRFLGALGRPVVAGTIGFIFLMGVLAFALWIWTDPVHRLAALVVSAAIVVLTVVSARRGTFAPRTVVEYRVEPGPPDVGVVSVVSAGRAVPAVVRFRDAGGAREISGPTAIVTSAGRIQSVSVDLPSTVAPELALWLHTITSDGSSTPTSGVVDIAIGGADPVRYKGTLDKLLVPGGDGPTTLTVSMSPGTVAS
jgi:amino acid permease